MRYSLLNEEEIYPIVTGFRDRPTMFGEKFEDEKFYTAIFTDGEIISTDETNYYTRDDFIIGGREQYEQEHGKLNVNLRKFYPAVDHIKINHIQINNANYVIKVLVGKEVLYTSGGAGLFYVIQKKNVYLNDPKNKETKLAVKSVLKYLANHNYTLGGIGGRLVFVDEEKTLNTTDEQAKKRVLRRN